MPIYSTYLLCYVPIPLHKMMYFLSYVCFKIYNLFHIESLMEQTTVVNGTVKIIARTNLVSIKLNIQSEFLNVYQKGNLPKDNLGSLMLHGGPLYIS